MARRIRIPVRSFGSEVGRPDVPELAEWLKGKTGTEVDLTTYRLERSLDAQDGVSIPAAGGLFYAERLREVFTSMKNGVLIDEPGVEPAAVTADALFVRERCKDARIALPAPHIMGFRDDYIGRPGRVLRDYLRPLRRTHAGYARPGSRGARSDSGYT